MDTATILKGVFQGRDLSPEELCSLMHQEEETRRVLDWADDMNHLLHGNRVTFVHNRNINYTNLCVNHCRFCGFRKDGEEPGSYFLSIGEVLDELEKTPKVNEVCIQGGLSPDLHFEYILEMLRAIKCRFPRIHIHAFSPMEIYYFSQKSGNSLRLTLERLIRNGLDSFPGTAAEILDDPLRRKICPEKIDTATWIEVVRLAHRIGLRSTATVLFGHVETPSQLTNHLSLLRALQGETRGFTEFIPLPFIPFQTCLGKNSEVHGVLSFTRQRYFYALCRIFFFHSIPNLQASWPKLGLGRALACIFSGVNDLGGTLYRENITRSAGGDHGEWVSLGEFRRKILETGKIPQLRDTLYHLLDDHLLDTSIREEGVNPLGEFVDRLPKKKLDNPVQMV